MVGRRTLARAARADQAIRMIKTTDGDKFRLTGNLNRLQVEAASQVTRQVAEFEWRRYSESRARRGGWGLILVPPPVKNHPTWSVKNHKNGKNTNNNLWAPQSRGHRGRL